MWLSKLHIEKSLFGFYNKVLAEELSKTVSLQAEYLQDHYMEEYNIDLKANILISKTLLVWDDIITAPAFGYGNVDNYCNLASCYHNLEKVKTPTLILMAKDDPIIGPKSICYEVAQRNPYLLMGVTKRGGHLGYFESVFSSK